jgi:serine/threonine protein kinase
MLRQGSTIRAKVLRLFQEIVAGAAHAHEKQIRHLDIKPQNILLKVEKPTVGYFGICFIEDNELTSTSEGPHGSMYYCAPELRGPKIKGDTPLAATDIYPLGKVLGCRLQCGPIADTWLVSVSLENSSRYSLAASQK